MSDDIFSELDAYSGDDTNFARERREIIKPPFAWCGGKSRCLDKILPHLPYDKGYIEVFGGSGAVLLARTKSPLEVFNDRYSGIVDFYKCLRDPSLYVKLIEQINLFVQSREEWYNCESNWSKQKEPVIRASMWYYMILHSFAKRGDAYGRSTYEVNVTSEAHLKKSLTFHSIHDRIKGVSFENLDFRDIFKDYSHPESVFYCDPPYLHTTYAAYDGVFFSKKDHHDLLDCVFKSNSFVAVSNHKNDLYDSYPWNKVIAWQQYRSITKLDWEDRTEQRDREHVSRTECLYIKERN